MQSPHLSPIRESASVTLRRHRRLRVHDGRPLPPLEARTPVEASPLHSIEVLAAGMLVTSIAACWIAVAVTVTAPLVAAGGLLARIARGPAPG